MGAEVEKQLKVWLVNRFKDSWWTPNFNRMANKMIEDCEIGTTADLTAAIETGDLEKVIDSHLKRMTELVKESKRKTVHLNEYEE